MRPDSYHRSAMMSAASKVRTSARQCATFLRGAIAPFRNVLAVCGWHWIDKPGNQHFSRFEVHVELVRDGESCEVEPRLKMRQFAMHTESRSVSKGLQVYDRESSRVSRSARIEDFYLLAHVHFREMLVSFSAGDVTGCPFLQADPSMTRCC